jgi:hypothetical protein
MCSVDTFSWLIKRNEQWDPRTVVLQMSLASQPRILVDWRHHVSLELLFSLQPYVPVFPAGLAILFTHYTGNDNHTITLAGDTCLALIHIAQRGGHSTHHPSEHFLLPQHSPISGMVRRSHYQLCPLTSVNGNYTNCRSSVKWQILARKTVVRIPARTTYHYTIKFTPALEGRISTHQFIRVLNLFQPHKSPLLFHVSSQNVARSSHHHAFYMTHSSRFSLICSTL